MKSLLQAANGARCDAEADSRLEWHENIDEVAAIVDDTPGCRTTPRSIVFKRRRSIHPEYLPPMSPLYEPLSYPLFYPYGGRGWGDDAHPTYMRLHPA